MADEKDCGSGRCGKCPECRERLAAGVSLAPSTWEVFVWTPPSHCRQIHAGDPNFDYAGVPGDFHFQANEYRPEG